MAAVTFSFSLDDDKDKRLVRWLKGLSKGERSRAIRKVLYAFQDQDDITLRDIYNEIQELKRSGVVMIEQKPTGTQDDDPALAEALENLSKLGL